MPQHPIRRLLIANRGEIVCRIARSARRLGIVSIAIYSDADRNALHVRSTDEAYHVGGAAAAESYLDIEKILAVARTVQADAIHPGYGFLSENAAFAAACEQAGLIFVGPPAAAIRAMGSKSASKAAVLAVGVPVAPGYHGDDQAPAHLAEQARRIGFPLIIKASAGGGGKGMQVVHSLAEVAPAIESAQRLARTSFGDDRLLLERYFAQSRHVEVQVFADQHGHAVTLFDRDCSVQRRHQKIIEEAPAPGLRTAVREEMAQAALRAARAVAYVGAGTVEFLVDEAQNFYFMEMNTRLQVEHPVTEMITGIDLVEWQLGAAAGEVLPQLQEEIKSRGTAIEARLYAEDPAQGYLPSVGSIAYLRLPRAGDGVRCDMGVEEGDAVSPYYDPMLGKIIAWAPQRAAAIERLRTALDATQLIGVTTNRALLVSVLANDEFRDAALATNFLSRCEAQLQFADPQPNADDLGAAALWLATQHTESDALWQDSRGWRLSAFARSIWRFAAGTAAVEYRAPGDYRVEVDNALLDSRLLSRGAEGLVIETAGRTDRIKVVERPGVLHLFSKGRQVRLAVRTTEDSLRAASAAAPGSLLTPLPGTIVAVHVQVNDTVSAGTPLVTVEAMKMEHTLTAPYAGVVARLLFGMSERVPAGATLVELTPA